MQELHMGEAQAKFLVNGLCEYIVGQLQEGNQLDFGGFRVGLTIRGSFPSANAPFGAKNEINVVMTPGKPFKDAVKEFIPENRTDLLKPHIHAIEDRRLEPKYGLSTLACHSKACIVGWNFSKSFSGIDDGVWLENRNRERVATAKILSNDGSLIDFIIENDLPAGEYWLVLGCRQGASVPVATVRRLVKLVD